MTHGMTKQELDALQALCDAATKEPWIVGDGTDAAFYCGTEAVVAPNNMLIVGRTLYGDDGDAEKLANIRLCAAARTAMPALIAEVRRLTTDLETMTAARDELWRRTKAFRDGIRELAFTSSDWSHGEHPRVVELDDIDGAWEDICYEEWRSPQPAKEATP